MVFTQFFRVGGWGFERSLVTGSTKYMVSNTLKDSLQS